MKNGRIKLVYIFIGVLCTVLWMYLAWNNSFLIYELLIGSLMAIVIRMSSYKIFKTSKEITKKQITGDIVFTIIMTVGLFYGLSK